MVLKDLFFPKHCFSCSALGSYICLDCQAKLEYVKKDRCLYCGQGSYLGFSHPNCQPNNGVDGYLSIFNYNRVLKQILKNIKYRLVKEGFNELFQVIKFKEVERFFFLKEEIQSAILVPIPLYSSRFNQRGFNQSEVLAQFFSRHLELPIEDVLKRKRPTKMQAGISSKRERYRNIKGAFEVKQGVSLNKKKTLLVDDVITTGTTVKEAARMLKKRGADFVFVLSIAKG